MHHGTCVTHVPWCMSGSLTCGDGENVPGIPGACAPAILRIWQEAHDHDYGCSMRNMTTHYSIVIPSAMASQITGVSIVCSAVCRSKKTSKFSVTGLCEGNPLVSGGFPSQRASNAENVSIWWRHHLKNEHMVSYSWCCLLMIVQHSVFIEGIGHQIQIQIQMFIGTTMWSMSYQYTQIQQKHTHTRTKKNTKRRKK